MNVVDGMVVVVDGMVMVIVKSNGVMNVTMAMIGV